MKEVEDRRNEKGKREYVIVVKEIKITKRIRDEIKGNRREMAVMHYMLWGESEEKNRNVLERKRNRSFLPEERITRRKEGRRKRNGRWRRKIIRSVFRKQ